MIQIQIFFLYIDVFKHLMEGFIICARHVGTSVIYILYYFIIVQHVKDCLFLAFIFNAFSGHQALLTNATLKN